MTEFIRLRAPKDWPDHSDRSEVTFLHEVETALLDRKHSPDNCLFTGFTLEATDDLLTNQAARQSTRAYTLTQWRDWLDCKMTPLWYAAPWTDTLVDPKSYVAVYDRGALVRPPSVDEQSVQTPYRLEEAGLYIASALLLAVEIVADVSVDS